MLLKAKWTVSFQPLTRSISFISASWLLRMFLTLSRWSKMKLLTIGCFEAITGTLN